MSRSRTPEKLVGDRPPESELAKEILRTARESECPFVVIYYPRYMGQGVFASGAVVCQHGRHKTLGGAARCAASHVAVLGEKCERYGVKVGRAAHTMWSATDGRRFPREGSVGE